MLERLAQRVPLKDSRLVEAKVPSDLEVEDVFTDPPPGWNDLDRVVARACGGEWLSSGRTPLLRVPSVVVPRECNYIVNPDHPKSASIVRLAPEPLVWDDRLFATRQA